MQSLLPTVGIKTPLLRFKAKYWPLLKSLQTGLLLTTGLAGYMSARCPVIHWPTLLGLSGSLLLAIAGSTLLNMWYDRDLDAKMQRTCNRPLSAGTISPAEVLRLGLWLSVLGVGWSAAMGALYGLVVFAGWSFDVVVYTIWLKRRTAWSIVWGGLAGGMPVLAGRTLGLGAVDWIGACLALAVLFWIPTHILTFNMRFFDDYQRAGVPTFPARYGFSITRTMIAISSIVAALAMALSAFAIGITQGLLHLIGLLAGILLVLAIYSLLRPSEKANFALFKYASLYMLLSMLLIALVAF